MDIGNVKDAAVTVSAEVKTVVHFDLPLLILALLGYAKSMLAQIRTTFSDAPYRSGFRLLVLARSA